MAVETSPLLLTAVVLVSLLAAVVLVSFMATTEAFNITRILNRFLEFSTFNGYLTQTKLYRDINSRRMITVLMVDNTDINGISGRPHDAIKRIISNHVVLDSFDQVKLEGLNKRSSILATLFQASSLAQEMQRFLNVTKSSEGVIIFRSTMKGRSPSAVLVKAVAAQPYNVSVLQISRPIIASVIDGNNLNLNSATSPSPIKAPAAAKSPAEAPTEEDPFVAPVGSPVDAPADAPLANVPVANAPVVEPPVGSTPSLAADTPTQSSASRASLSMGVAVVMGLILSSLSVINVLSLNQLIS